MINRFNQFSSMQANALTMNDLQRQAPSIFTGEGAERVSDKYTHIPTIAVVQGLMREGFNPVWATQCRTRSHTKALYTKHMLRFRHTNAIANEHGLFPEVVLVNSHDGLSSYRLMAGIFRMVCANGLIAGDTYSDQRIRHQGDIIGNVIEGTYSVITESTKMLESSDNMARITLNSDERHILAETAHQLVFTGDSDEDKARAEAIKPELLLRVRRHEESGKTDLFTAFNVIQENVMKGGRGGWVRTDRGHRRTTMRSIQSIDKSTSLNRALWTLAEKMAALKSNCA